MKRNPAPLVKPALVRKAIWTALLAGLSAVSAMLARRLASKVWRVATGEEPPAKK
jgi:hypothetical protein